MPLPSDHMLIGPGVLADTIEEIDEQSGGSSTITVIGGDGRVQFRYSGGADAVRASAGASLLMMRALALPGAPTCSGCAHRLKIAEAALRVLGVGEELWSMVGAPSGHVH